MLSIAPISIVLIAAALSAAILGGAVTAAVCITIAAALEVWFGLQRGARANEGEPGAGA